ncbi:MAG: VOC family protein [Candidatus Saccharibacteria bacterium]|nr:VOC family protein [Candidatus Saccharibacteria bacterium]
MDKSVGVIKCIVINTTDHPRSVEFWSKVLGRNVTAEYAPYAELKKEGEITVVIQKVDAIPSQSTGVHFDLKVEHLEDAIDLVCRLGGSHVKTLKKAKWSWAIMQDPDGNVFCLCD